MDSAVFLIDRGGRVLGLYTDEVDWPALGSLRVTRASTVEFDGPAQGWVVRILHTGDRLGPFARRVNAIDAEVASLTEWLRSVPPTRPLTAWPCRAPSVGP